VKHTTGDKLSMIRLTDWSNFRWISFTNFKEFTRQIFNFFDRIKKKHFY